MSLSNTQALIFARGWQGGTVHQIAQELDTTVETVLCCPEPVMGELLCKAQALQREQCKIFWVSKCEELCKTSKGYPTEQSEKLKLLREGIQ